MSKRDVWMPFYFGDYFKDTLHLTTEGHGAYLLLIAAYWSGGEPLPDNDAELASIAKAPPSRWRRVLRPMIERFFVVGEGVWRHGRVDQEIAATRREPGAGGASERSQRLSEAGRRGAARRWGGGEGHANGHGQGHQEAIDSDGLSMAKAMASDGLSQSQSPSEPKPEAIETHGPASPSDGQPAGQGHGHRDGRADGQKPAETELDREARFIAETFHAMREHFWGMDPPKPTGRELAIARAWVQRGAEYEPCRAYFERELGRMCKRDKPPPSVLSFFAESLPRDLGLRQDAA